MAERSDLFISPKQGTDQVWLMAVTKYMIDQGWHDQAFIDENVNYFEDYKETLKTYTLDYAERITGLSKENIIQIAEMIRDADGTCVLWEWVSHKIQAVLIHQQPFQTCFSLRATIAVQVPALILCADTITCKAHVIWNIAWLAAGISAYYR